MRPSWMSCVFVFFHLTATPLNAQPVQPTVVWVRPAGAYSVAFSPDGRYVVSGGLQTRNPFSFGRVDVWAAGDGAQLGHAETHGPTGVIGYTDDVAFSPDGTTLATANGTAYCGPEGGCSADRPGLFTWTVPQLVPLAGRTDLSPASGIDYSRDGSRLAVSYYYDNDGRVRTHDASTLATVLDLPGHTYSANDIAYSPDGNLIASVGDDGNLSLWNAQSGTLVRSMFHGTYLEGGEPISVAFSPDGQFVASSGDGYELRAKVWRVSNGTLIHDLDATLGPNSYGRVVVAFSPNGAYLVGGLQQYVPGDEWRGSVRFWNTVDGSIALEYAETGPPPYYGGVTSLAFSSSQNNLFAYTVAGAVKVVSTPLNMASPIASVVPNEMEYGLSPAYPNPFSSRTLMKFSVAKTQRVEADAFDAQGRRVAALFKGSLSPGAEHTLAVDGAGLPSGRYHVRIRGEYFLARREVTLIK